jgi:hypothetical protein
VPYDWGQPPSHAANLSSSSVQPVQLNSFPESWAAPYELQGDPGPNSHFFGWLTGHSIDQTHQAFLITLHMVPHFSFNSVIKFLNFVQENRGIWLDAYW